MSHDRVIRSALWVAVGLNAIGVLVFALVFLSWAFNPRTAIQTAAA